MTELDRRLLLKSVVATSIALWHSRLHAASDAGRFYGGVYVQMGTSITSGLRAPDAYITPLTVGERLGMTSHNVGIEGACVGYYGDPNDPMSLSGLTDAIISKDWSAQESAAKNMDVTLSPIIAKLKLIDFDKVSVLGLEYGLNDFTLHVPIGGNTEVAKNTFKGALNCSIQRLLTAFPKLNLFLMTPAWSLPRP